MNSRQKNERQYKARAFFVFFLCVLAKMKPDRPYSLLGRVYQNCHLRFGLIKLGDDFLEFHQLYCGPAINAVSNQLLRSPHMNWRLMDKFI